MFNAIEVGPEHILIPAERFHSSRFCFWDNTLQNIESGMVWSLNVLERRMRVILLMRTREVAAVEVGVVLLFAVVRQWLSGDLPSGNAAAVAERCDQQSVYFRVLLETIEYWSDAFIRKRNRSHLNGNGAIRGLCREWKISAKPCGSDEFCKIASREFCHGVGQYRSLSRKRSKGASLNSRSLKEPATAVSLTFSIFPTSSSTLNRAQVVRSRGKPPWIDAHFFYLRPPVLALRYAQSLIAMTRWLAQEVENVQTTLRSVSCKCLCVRPELTTAAPREDN